MNSKGINGRILGVLIALGALNASALFAQTIVSPVLAAPAQSGNQPQDQNGTPNDGQTSPDNNGGGSGADTTSNNGGQHKTPWQQQNAHMHKMMDDLNMTPEQRQQVHIIIKNHRSRIMAVNRDASLSQDEKNKRRKDIRMDARKKFQALLTPEQKQKLKEIAEQWKKDHPKNVNSNTDNSSTGNGNGSTSENNQPGTVRSAAPATVNDDDPASVLVGGDDDDASAPNASK